MTPRGASDISIEDKKDEVENRVQLLKPSRVLLSIKDGALKTQFKAQKARKYKRFHLISMLLLAGIIFAQTLITLIVRRPLDISAPFIVIRSIFSGLMILMVSFSKYLEKRERVERILLFTVLIYGVFVEIFQSYHSDISQEWFHKVSFLEMMIILVMGLTNRKFEFVDCLSFYVVLTAIWMTYWSLNWHLGYTYVFYYFSLVLYTLARQYIAQYKDITGFNLRLKQNQRYYEQNNLISQLLPTHVSLFPIYY